MSLVLHQQSFARMVARLIDKAVELGYEVTLGDAYRDPRCPYGSTRSLHHQRLAIDINLFRNGKYLTRTEDYEPLGSWWERQGGVWGGRWQDGNHFQYGGQRKR